MADQDLDCSGLSCPLPILRATRALRNMASNDLLRVTATDPNAPKDFKALCESTPHELVDSQKEGDRYVITVRRGPVGPG
ncbi:MAG: sulfurtransferase TusA family protein [Magnetospiraceae bacterium]